MEEHHVKVYAGKKTEDVAKGTASAGFIKGSLISPSLESSSIERQMSMPSFTGRNRSLSGMACTFQDKSELDDAPDRAAVCYDYLPRKAVHGYHVLQADETPVLRWTARPAGNQLHVGIPHRTDVVYGMSDRPV